MDLLQQLAAIGIVFALLGALIFVLQRKGLARFAMGKPPAAYRFTQLGKLALAPNSSLHLVRLGEKVFLIGVSPNGCTPVFTQSWSEFERESGAATYPAAQRMGGGAEA